jgi:predicted SAM-dependent methyltransferase|tara:strand:+ start:808 stop:1635 length:828 start_codon:yes stop_codon:yes gene_type:complete
MFKSFLKKLIEKKGNYLEQIYDQNQFDKNRIFVNVGSGSFYKKGWICLDAETKDFSDRHKEAMSNNAFVPFEIKEGIKLPFEDASVDIFYCSHVLEHLRVSDMEFLLGDFHRCLKKNGLLRIAVPDADLGLRAVKYSNSNYFNWNKRSREGIEEEEIDYFIDMICSAKSIFYTDNFFNLEEKINFKNIVERMINEKLDNEQIFDYLIDSSSDERFDFTGHINWFNYKKLKDLLYNYSFQDVWKSSRNASISSEMQNRKHFDRTHPQFSLYIEAIK